MPELIRVRPTPSRRQAFARWAVEQRPKIRTVSPVEFAVPADRFVAAPEEILIGALVNGHRYVSPDEDAANGTPPPGAELTGVATAEAFTRAEGGAAPGPAEGAGAAADGDSSGPDFAPLDDAPTDHHDQEQGRGERYSCDLCPRAFTTERGRDSHRRQAHRED